MTSLLMKSTSADKDTLHEQDQPLKKLAYVSNHRGPLLSFSNGFKQRIKVHFSPTRQNKLQRTWKDDR
ncbi:hypothetical protein VCSRO24_2667 [Vibrio cholerae]|nr:hypothetical protein VCSRO24_2667 [Vibrio cholerae]